MRQGEHFVREASKFLSQIQRRRELRTTAQAANSTTFVRLDRPGENHEPLQPRQMKADQISRCFRWQTRVFHSRRLRRNVKEVDGSCRLTSKRHNLRSRSATRDES